MFLSSTISIPFRQPSSMSARSSAAQKSLKFSGAFEQLTTDTLSLMQQLHQQGQVIAGKETAQDVFQYITNVLGIRGIAALVLSRDALALEGVEASKDQQCITTMMDAMNDCLGFVEGMSQEAFLKDKKTQAAVMNQLALIGEASKQLSEPLKQKLKCLPWKQLYGLRNILVHNLDRKKIDLTLIWQIVSSELTELRRELILRDFEGAYAAHLRYLFDSPEFNRYVFAQSFPYQGESGEKQDPCKVMIVYKNRFPPHK